MRGNVSIVEKISSRNTEVLHLKLLKSYISERVMNCISLRLMKTQQFFSLLTFGGSSIILLAVNSFTRNMA